jgi:hypothetical protein
MEPTENIDRIKMNPGKAWRKFGRRRSGHPPAVCEEGGGGWRLAAAWWEV